MNENDVALNSPRAWLLASRPKTLTGAAVPVMIGLSTAWAHLNATGQPLKVVPAVLCMLFALIMLTLNRGGEYRDKWQKWLDLEEKIYRPLLLTVLPLTIGLFARIMDRITDRLALLLRKTVFRDAPIKPERVEGTVFTRFVGHGMDVIVAKLKGKSEVEPEYETRLALRAMEQKENNLVTMRSLSYGLMLACLGIFVMLGFILYLVFIK